MPMRSVRDGAGACDLPLLRFLCAGPNRNLRDASFPHLTSLIRYSTA